METRFRWTLITAIAPIAWGSTYFVTREFLPVDHPLWGGVIRALPAGLLLLAIRPRLPRGAWWWRYLVLGALNMGAFFALVYLAAQLLPTSLASTIMATSPIVIMVFAWALLSQRPAVWSLIGAGLGILGVAIMLAAAPQNVNIWGVLSSVGAITMSSYGYVLSTRWSTPDIDVLASTSWQLIAGGLLLLPFALVVEGASPALDGPALLGFGYVSIVATALAFAAWFAGLRRLEAGTVGLIGLLNPVTGVLLGTLVAGEALAARQGVGLAIVGAGILLGQPAVRRLITRTARSRSDRARPDPTAARAAPRRAAAPASSRGCS